MAGRVTPGAARVNPWLGALCAAAVAAGADALLRRQWLASYSGTDWFFHAVSGVYEFLLFFFVFALLPRRRAAGVLLAGVYLLVLAGSYNFFLYFNTLPGINTFSYLFLSPQNSLTIARDGLSVPVCIAGAAVFTAMVFGARHLGPRVAPAGRVSVLAAAAVFAALTLVLHNNTRLKDNRTLPFTNCVFAFKHGYADYRNTGKLDHISARSFEPLPKTAKTRAPFNVIVIMNESVNPYYLQEYGGRYPADPGMYARIQERPGEFFLFRNAWCNSTVTAVSVPFTMAGMNPVQGKHELIRVPLVYDYLKNRFSNVRTAYITSWSYDDYPNFKAFFGSPALDMFVYRELLNAPKVVDMGTDDSVMLGYFRQFTRALQPGETFFTALHYSNTHYPYYAPPGSSGTFSSNGLVNDYVNSLRYLDNNLSQLFAYLQEQGLLRNTVIIATSDHSESLGEQLPEKGHFGKFSIFKNRVPLWMYVPEGLLPPAQREQLAANTEAWVSNNDLMPTVFNLYSLPAPLFTRYGSSLLAPLPAGRPLYLYNGKGENRVSSKEYFGMLMDGRLYLRTTEHNSTEHNLYLPEDYWQQHDSWQAFGGKDSIARIISGLHLR